MGEQTNVSVGTVQAETEEEVVNTEEVEDDWVPNIDLSHLNEDKKKRVMEILMEEKDVFSRSDCDIGNVEDFQMKISVEDDVPVKEAYRKIPRNLYTEVRNYINDLKRMDGLENRTHLTVAP